MKKVLVTGANGQLGSEIQSLASIFINLDFSFTNYPQYDISDAVSIDELFEKNSFDFCVNCAAYTAVDLAESEKDKADAINVLGTENLADSCKKYDVTLFHISTDFVFDGTTSSPLKETDKTTPINYYGASKLGGEIRISEKLEKYFILRTSWLYSSFGSNFVKTMLRLSKEKSELRVISDQIGSPTYARDLARVILQLIDQNQTAYGTYHYSNEGVASWYDFTHAIFEYRKLQTPIIPIASIEYPTPARRPGYSVMDKAKFKKTFNQTIPHWRDSLAKCLHLIDG